MGDVDSDRVTQPLRFQERLWVPLWWWPCAGVIVAMFTAEVIPGLPGSWQIASALIICGIVVSWLLTVGAAPVGVTSQGLKAGAAVLPYAAVGAVRLVEPTTRKALLGPGGTDGAFVLTRDWVRGAVYVEVVGEDPTPYWLVSTRQPARLAAALRRPDDDGPTTF